MFGLMWTTCSRLRRCCCCRCCCCCCSTQPNEERTLFAAVVRKRRHGNGSSVTPVSIARYRKRTRSCSTCVSALWLLQVLALLLIGLAMPTCCARLQIAPTFANATEQSIATPSNANVTNTINTNISTTADVKHNRTDGTTVVPRPHRVLILIERPPTTATNDGNARRNNSDTEHDGISVERLKSAFIEYARAVGARPPSSSSLSPLDWDDNGIAFRIINGLRDLWRELNMETSASPSASSQSPLWSSSSAPFSTIIYAMDETRQRPTRDSDLCSMVSELSGWHHQRQPRVLFWPCSTMSSSFAQNSAAPTSISTMPTTKTMSTSATITSSALSRMVDAVRQVLDFMNATQVSIVPKNDEDDDWMLPITLAVSQSGIPYRISDFADLVGRTVTTTSNNTNDNVASSSKTVIITSSSDPDTLQLLEQHVLVATTPTCGLIVDMRSDTVRHRAADTCHNAANDSASGAAATDAAATSDSDTGTLRPSSQRTPKARRRVPSTLPPNRNAINYQQQKYRNHSAIYLLTVLSTNYRRYLELLINQQSIDANDGTRERKRRKRLPATMVTTLQATHPQTPTNTTLMAGRADETTARSSIKSHTKQGRRRGVQHRSRRAIEIANEIKSTAKGSNDGIMMETVTNDTHVSRLSSSLPTSHLTPEIISKIKQFYSLTGQATSMTPRATAASANVSATSASMTSTSAESIYDYCQRFVSGSYRLDANTTAAVCDILLLDDTVVDIAGDDALQQSHRGDSIDDGIDIADGSDENATDDYVNDASWQQQRQRNVTVPIIHMAECLVAVKWFALFDFIIANGTAPKSHDSHSVPDPQINHVADSSVPEFTLLHYAVDALTGWLWPPVWRVPMASETGAQMPTDDGFATMATPNLSVATVNWVMDGLQMFWRCGTHCWTVTLLVVLMLLVFMVSSVVAVIAVRNYLLKQRLSRGPNKIVLSANDFVFPVEGRRVDEGIEAMLCCWLQQLQEFGGPEVDKPDLLKGSIGSLKNLGLSGSTAGGGTVVVPRSTASANSVGGGGCVVSGAGGCGLGAESGSGSLAKHRNTLDMRARYNGDLVQLKEMPMGTSGELKSRAMDHLVMLHGLRHENINPLIGWLNDPARNAMVTEWCSRGSLQDVLIMDDIKLDWSFRLSLLTDLVRGMRYLHASPLRVHGALTSRNCVVDARWVLKITDYGLQTFREVQGIVSPARSAKELLWTAPELVRHQRSSPLKCAQGTQMGDVYSFGIIMQEVVVRGEPYCMLSLTPEEIIAKIEKPPPLIRPSVSKGAAPPEAINIMRQCWAESPEMRPDFNSVYERFKQLNHGRKVNFVDTMFQMLEKYSNNLEELIRERTGQLEMERKKTEQLLNRMLPNSVAEKLKMGLSVEPEEFSDVTIYFSDIVGFTTIAAHCTPVQVVDLLNDLYTCFDDTINAYSVYKVETIGDAYMVVSGLPVRIPDHAEQIATMALDLLHQSGNFHVKHLPDVPLQLRIGLHTGPCCAGVVGLTMPRYCLFGDTVNTASRMESTGSSWRIHLSEATRERLVQAGGYQLEPRGPIEIKGKGLMHTYWLLGKHGFDKVLPTPPPIGESHGLAECLLRNVQPTQYQQLPSPIPASTTALTQNNITASSTSHARLVGLQHQSSSQSSSQCGDRSSSATIEQIDVKVEITPPRDYNNGDASITHTLHPLQHQQTLSNSFSLDSNAALSAACLNLSDFKTTPFPSPHIRKLGDLSAGSHDSCGGGGGGGVGTGGGQIGGSSMLLNTMGASRYGRDSIGGGAGSSIAGTSTSAGNASHSANKLYKKLEEMMDLSSPYNHYRCLSACPSETNLTQFHQQSGVGSEQHRYAYASGSGFGGVSIGGIGGGGGGSSSGGTGGIGSISRLESRPGSSRLLRRQFSLDRDDCAQQQQQTAQQQQHQQHHFRHNLEIPTLQEYQRTSPTNSAKSMCGTALTTGGSCGSNSLLGAGRLLKQHSTSVAVDLEKIEEIPISPTSVLSASKSNSGLASSQVSEDATTTGSRTPEQAPPTVRSNSNEISLTVDALIVR